MNDHDEELNRWATLYAIIIAVLFLVITKVVEADTTLMAWDRDTVPVYHNPQGAVVPVGYAETVIQQSISRWNYADINHRFEYAGQTANSWINGAIVVRHVDTDEVSGRFRYYYNEVDGQRVISRGQIWISTVHRKFAGDCWRGTMLHELGHAAGIGGHIDSDGNVMHTYSYCNTSLTALDITSADGSPCHAELLPGYDLYLPAVWDGEVTVEGELSYYGWGFRVTSADEVNAHCKPLEQDGDRVIIDVWSRGALYKAWLQQVGANVFTLERAIEVTE